MKNETMNENREDNLKWYDKQFPRALRILKAQRQRMESLYHKVFKRKLFASREIKRDDWSFISNDQKHFSVYMILFWCRDVIIQCSIAMFVPTFTFQRENRAIYSSPYDH